MTSGVRLSLQQMHQQSTWCAWGYTLAPTEFHPGVSTMCKKHLGSEIPSIWHLKSSTDHETVWVCDLYGPWSWSKDRMSSREPGGSAAPQRPSSLQGHLSKVFLGGTSCLSELVPGLKTQTVTFLCTASSRYCSGRYSCHFLVFFCHARHPIQNQSVYWFQILLRVCLQSKQGCKSKQAL